MVCCMDKVWVLTVTYRGTSWVLATAKSRQDAEKFRATCLMALGLSFSIVVQTADSSDLVLYKCSDRLNNVLESVRECTFPPYSAENSIKRIVYEVFDLPVTVGGGM